MELSRVPERVTATAASLCLAVTAISAFHALNHKLETLAADVTAESYGLDTQSATWNELADPRSDALEEQLIIAGGALSTAICFSFASAGFVRSRRLIEAGDSNKTYQFSVTH